MTDLSDRDRELHNELLRICVTPQTAEEIADKWGCHAQTVRRGLWYLRDLDKIRESTRKRGRKKLWQTVGGFEASELRLATTRGTVGLSDCAAMYSDTATPLGNLIAGALGYLWTRSFYSQLDQEIVHNAANMGSLDPYLHVRIALANILPRAKQQVEILEQLLFDNPELFQDGVAPLNNMGNVDRMEMESQAKWFEMWVHDWFDRNSGSAS